MTALLALDATGDGCSVALLHDDSCEFVVDDTPRGHARNILDMIDKLLVNKGITPGELDAIAFARGPGSFTGVRIAASVAQGLAFSKNLPVVPVSSLVVTAQAAFREQQAERCLVALDARMDEVYWASCVLGSNQLMTLSGSEQLSRPNAVVLEKAEGVSGVGGAWAVYPDALAAGFASSPEAIYATVQARADDVAELATDIFAAGGAVSAEQAIPVYLRDASAWRKPS